MYSQATFFVWHDDSTDSFQEFVENTAAAYADGDIVMVDYSVVVDIPDPTPKREPVTIDDIMDLLRPVGLCTADTLMENGDRLCTDIPCTEHRCDASTCNC